MAYYCRALADSSDFTLDRYLYRAYTNLSLQLGLCLFVKKDKGGGARAYIGHAIRHNKCDQNHLHEHIEHRTD